VTREVTERPEAVASGNALLVGPDQDRLLAAAARLLENPVHYEAMATVTNPYGDGQAARRIAECLAAV